MRCGKRIYAAVSSHTLKLQFISFYTRVPNYMEFQLQTI